MQLYSSRPRLTYKSQNKAIMVYTPNISNLQNASPFQTGFSSLFSQCDLIRIAIQENDFLPFELVREDKGIYMHVVRPVLAPIAQLDIYEMGGRMGEENVYGYLAIRKNGKSKTAYLLLSKPADFGSGLLKQFKSALRRMLFFDKAIVR